MSRVLSKNVRLIIVLICSATAVAAGYWLVQRYVQDVMAGKTVREGAARVIEKMDMNCEEAKRFSLENFDWFCAPEERALLLYLKVEEFKMVEPQVNSALLERERENEAQNIWRCETLHYYRLDVPAAKVGDLRRFQFQYFPHDGEPLIFLEKCLK